MQALWQARNDTQTSTGARPPTRTPDGEKREPTVEDHRAAGARVRARHAAAKQRLLH